MNEINQKQSGILWGIVIGGSLGLMESAISIGLWHEFGSPDFLVRSYQLKLHTIMLTTGGIVCGIIFGILVLNMCGRIN